MPIEDYELGEELGSGGMGRVRAARHRRLGGQVVVKELTLSDGQARARFEREARLLFDRVRHPLFPTVKDLFEDDAGRLYLVMDRAPGVSVQRWIERSPTGRLAPAVVRTIGMTVCAGLAHLHELGVLHRDIKPDNLVADGDPHGHGPTAVMLVDFGIAAGVPSAPVTCLRGSSLDDTGVFTPHFAPPEQVLGRPCDARSDLYQVGATLYAMLTGLLPPEATTRLARDGLTRPGDVAPEADAGLCAAIERALALRPADRFGSAAEMARALAASARSGPPAVAAPSGAVTGAGSAASVAPSTGSSVDDRELLTQQRRRFDIRRR